MGRWGGARSWVLLAVLATAAAATAYVLAGCTGPAGPSGSAGTPGTSTGTFSGKVANSLTNAAVSGATVSIQADPSIKAITAQTDASGSFTMSAPIGQYTATISKADFTNGTQTVTLVAGQTTTRNVTLAPKAPVVVSAGAAQSSTAGGTVSLKATPDLLDNSTVSSYQWTQVSGAKATIDNPTSASISVKLASAADYKKQFLAGIKQLDRFVVQAINPDELTKGETAACKVTVATSSGSYSGTTTVTVSLPYEISSGLRNVPTGVNVLLHGKKQASYNWALTGPSGSKAALDSATDQNPSFVPDVVGNYTVTEKTSNVTLQITGGTWAGAITGIDAKGLPVTAGCSACHNGKTAPDKFTDWKASGHAQIFTQNVNTTGDHYGTGCFECHTVGYNTDAAAKNNGADDQTDYQTLVSAAPWNTPNPNNWANIVAKYPQFARDANIQCENCHGPNNNGAHPGTTVNPARVSLSADVCATCHGEPPRHGRFQQWQTSLHGNYDLAISEATSTSCARCHTAQGFLAWIDQGDLTKQLQGANGNMTAAELAKVVTPDTAEPQTCVTCHDPHAQGTTTGLTTNATVRFTDNTAVLPAGFKATDVGKGAICITCHNTRNGVHDDSFPVTSYQAPHAAGQGDVLMGENAYFVPTERSVHSFLQDTCVTCHLVESPAPADYSLPGNGTNHAFNASIEICSDCHAKTMDGKALQSGVESRLEALSAQMGAYLMKKLPAQFTIKGVTPGDTTGDAVVIDKSNVASIDVPEGSIHGQQGYTIHFKSAVNMTYTPAGATAKQTASLTEVEVQLGNITSDGTKAVIDPSDPLVKVGWNYLLVAQDGSFGVHNPTFVSDVIGASAAAIK